MPKSFFVLFSPCRRGGSVAKSAHELSLAFQAISWVAEGLPAQSKFVLGIFVYSIFLPCCSESPLRGTCDECVNHYCPDIDCFLTTKRQRLIGHLLLPALGSWICSGSGCSGRERGADTELTRLVLYFFSHFVLVWVECVFKRRLWPFF